MLRKIGTSCPVRYICTDILRSILRIITLFFKSTIYRNITKSIPIGCVPRACQLYVCVLVAAKGGVSIQGGGNKERVSIQGVGYLTPTPPTPHQKNVRHLWKQYLPATTIADGNKKKAVYVAARCFTFAWIDSLHSTDLAYPRHLSKLG